jgi:hypothetical protein
MQSFEAPSRCSRWESSLSMIYIVNKSQNFFIKHSWSNGRIIAFQAIGPGSTPGGCTPSFSSIAVVAEYVHDFFGGLEDGEGG